MINKFSLFALSSLFRGVIAATDPAIAVATLATPIVTDLSPTLVTIYGVQVSLEVGTTYFNEGIYTSLVQSCVNTKLSALKILHGYDVILTLSTSVHSHLPEC